jgi:hypothetical protein
MILCEIPAMMWTGLGVFQSLGFLFEEFYYLGPIKIADGSDSGGLPVSLVSEHD